MRRAERSPELSESDPPEVDRRYSKAFQNLVGNDQDTVGLLAYALFKQAIREDAERGLRGGGDRDPSPTVVEAYRQSAERRLEELIRVSLEEATPAIQRSAMLDALGATEASIKGHVSARTGFVSALFTNVLAWIITLAATVLILSVAGRPDPGQTLSDAAKALGRPAPKTPAADSTGRR